MGGKLKHEWGWNGEDVFLRHCLGILKVSRVDNFKLLSEDRCFYENPAKTGCTSGKVSFHPFKSVDAWLKCYDQAIHNSGGMSQSSGHVSTQRLLSVVETVLAESAFS